MKPSFSAISWSAALLFLYQVSFTLSYDFGEFDCITSPLNRFFILQSLHICVKLSLASCHISICSNISSISVQFLVLASLLRLVELSWCSILRVKASNSPINLLARESSGRATGSMLETLNPLWQNVLPELQKHKQLG